MEKKKPISTSKLFIKFFPASKSIFFNQLLRLQIKNVQFLTYITQIIKKAMNRFLIFFLATRPIHYNFEVLEVYKVGL